MRLDEIDLSDLDGFWMRPIAERNEAYALLRSNAPVRLFAERETAGLPTGPGYYAITRYDDIVTASKNPQVFCSSPGTSIVDYPPEFELYYASILNLDDPEHYRVKRIVSTGFPPKILARVENDIVDFAYEIIDSIRERGTCDFVTDVAAELTSRVTASLLGIPPSCRGRVSELTGIIHAPYDAESAGVDNQPVAAAVDALGELTEIIDELADSRIGMEPTDLITAMVNNEVEGERLARLELQALFMLSCGVADIASRAAICWGIWYLTEHPDQREIWQSDFDGVTRTAVEEIIRMASPVGHFRRTVTRDGARLGDHEFSEGDKVVMFYGSGNHDEENFADAHEFQVLRDPNNHLAFGGSGPHHCVGAHLARREITMVYKALFETLPDIEATGEPVRTRSDLINGINHLPCEFTPV